MRIKRLEPTALDLLHLARALPSASHGGLRALVVFNPGGGSAALRGAKQVFLADAGLPHRFAMLEDSRVIPMIERSLG